MMNPPPNPGPFGPPAGTSSSPYQAPLASAFEPPQNLAVSPEVAARLKQAATLVRWSNYLAIGGLGTLLLGACAVGMATQNTIAAGVVGFLGISTAVGGAVIGQIGRGMQGRVI